jgi:hypothetical protein
MLLLDRPAWMDHCNCAGRTDEMVLFLNSKPNAAGRAALAHALTICAACPVRAECADWAIHLPASQRITGAVVGGMTPGELNAARNTKAAQTERNRRHRPRCGSRYALSLHRQFDEHCQVCLDAAALERSLTRPPRPRAQRRRAA